MTTRSGRNYGLVADVKKEKYNQLCAYPIRKGENETKENFVNGMNREGWRVKYMEETPVDNRDDCNFILFYIHNDDIHNGFVFGRFKYSISWWEDSRYNNEYPDDILDKYGCN